MKVVYLFSLFLVSYAQKRIKWDFSFSKKQIAPAAARISTLNDMTMDKCAIKCTKTEYCQSVSYNDKTKQCILQATLSTDKYLKPVDDTDFTYGDMIPALPENERMGLCSLLSPCQNNGTCIDVSGVEDYSCNCTDDYNGTNCANCFKSEVFKSQNCTVAGPSVLLIGGYDGSSGVNTMELYDKNEPANSRILNKVLDAILYSQVSVTLKDKRLAIISGYKIPNHLADTTFFNLRLNQFAAGPMLQEVRSYASGAVVNDIVYICGGEGVDFKSKKTCEKMDMNTIPLQWVYIASMNKEHSYSTMVAYNGYLYVVGGKDLNDVALSTVECYDPNMNTWQIKAPMSEARMGCGVALLNGMIYVCGGTPIWQANDVTNTCERYVPGTDQWFSVVPMIGRRNAFVLAAIDDKLFAFGSRWHEMNTVEWYDMTANNWTMTEPMKTIRGMGAGVVFN